MFVERANRSGDLRRCRSVTETGAFWVSLPVGSPVGSGTMAVHLSRTRYILFGL
ncbi:hypothetical protein CKA32_001557 [Geitlerinema sp. FC II]|nr:hypothetical protein CKA32_001557 [Geitlerinema sp. FC II]